jgi:hypothetical protein
MRIVPVAGKPHIYNVRRGGGRGKASPTRGRSAGS